MWYWEAGSIGNTTICSLRFYFWGNNPEGRGSDALFVWCSRIFIILCHTALIAFPKLTLFRHFWHTAAITFAYLFNASLLKEGPFNRRGLKAGQWPMTNCGQFSWFQFHEDLFQVHIGNDLSLWIEGHHYPWAIRFFSLDTILIRHFGLFLGIYCLTTFFL